MKNAEVQILIPIYRTNLSPLEHRSIARCQQLLGAKYPILFIKPESLEISPLTNRYPKIGIQSFEDHYFKGIAGYNALMLSPHFYASFRESRYILICQTDTFLFSDDLERWTKTGYDYIGAPWIPRHNYDSKILSAFLRLRKLINLSRNRIDQSFLWWRIGNGGLSLRKTETFYTIALHEKERIAHYLQMSLTNSRYNEDVFWGSLLEQKESGYQLPTWREALGFAFDVHPRKALSLTNGVLPFGCHGWTKKRYYRFWSPFIQKAEQTLPE